MDIFRCFINEERASRGRDAAPRARAAARSRARRPCRSRGPSCRRVRARGQCRRRAAEQRSSRSTRAARPYAVVKTTESLRVWALRMQPSGLAADDRRDLARRTWEELHNVRLAVLPRRAHVGARAHHVKVAQVKRRHGGTGGPPSHAPILEPQDGEVAHVGRARVRRRRPGRCRAQPTRTFCRCLFFLRKYASRGRDAARRARAAAHSRARRSCRACGPSCGRACAAGRRRPRAAGPGPLHRPHAPCGRSGCGRPSRGGPTVTTSPVETGMNCTMCALQSSHGCPSSLHTRST